MGCRRRCMTASCCATKVEALVALGKGESYRQSAWNARRSAGPPTAPGRTRSFSVDRRMTGDWVGQYASVLGDALLPHRWPYAIAVDEWEVRTVRYRDDGTRVQRGSDHYLVMAVVGYPNSRDPGRLWKLAARPSNSQAHWDSVFAELDPRGDRPPTILVADGAWGAGTPPEPAGRTSAATVAPGTARSALASVLPRPATGPTARRSFASSSVARPRAGFRATSSPTRSPT